MNCTHGVLETEIRSLLPCMPLFLAKHPEQINPKEQKALPNWGTEAKVATRCSKAAILAQLY